MLKLGIGLNDLQMGEKCSEQRGTQERDGSDGRQGGPKRRSRGWCKHHLRVFKAGSLSPQMLQAPPEPGRPSSTTVSGSDTDEPGQTFLDQPATLSKPHASRLTSMTGPAKLTKTHFLAALRKNRLGLPTAWPGHQILEGLGCRPRGLDLHLGAMGGIQETLRSDASFLGTALRVSISTPGSPLTPSLINTKCLEHLAGAWHMLNKGFQCVVLSA